MPMRRIPAHVPHARGTPCTMGPHLPRVYDADVAQAIRIDPSMTEAYQMLSQRLSRSPKKKTRQSAIKHATKAVKLKPDLPSTYTTLGSALARLESVSNFTKLSKVTRGKAIDGSTESSHPLRSSLCPLCFLPSVPPALCVPPAMRRASDVVLMSCLVGGHARGMQSASEGPSMAH